MCEEKFKVGSKMLKFQKEKGQEQDNNQQLSLDYLVVEQPAQQSQKFV